MVPARSLLRRYYDSYGAGCTSYDHRSRRLSRLDSSQEKSVVAPSLMAEKDATARSAERGEGDTATGERGEGGGGGTEEEAEEEGEEGGVVAGGSGFTRGGAVLATAGDAVGTSGVGRGDDHDDHAGWLRLGIGVESAAAATSVVGGQVDPSGTHGRTGSSGSGLLELHLFSDRPDRAPPLPMAVARPATMPQAVFQTAATPYAAGSSSTGGYAYRRYPPDVGWGMWNVPGPSTSSMLLPVPPGYGMGSGGRQFMYMPGTSSSVMAPAETAKVVSPPPRPQTGLWFVLLAAQQQAKEPFLPQIPKSYLRIKDGRMTIKLLMKYLVRKLGLDSESEVEITCRGQQLHPLLTMQHVRDMIWCSRDVAVSPMESPSSHVMTLLYGRSSDVPTQLE